MPNPIEVNALSKRYGDLTAVHDFSLTVKTGEVLGLVGPNGAGKTTTLRALAGIHPPSDGQILICGHDIVEDGVEAKRNLAFFPDEPRLFDYLTVEEPDLAVLLARRHRAGLEVLRRDAELAREGADRLHGGAPLTGLDPLGIRRMKESIVRRSKEGAAVILSSHLLHLVEELCDTVAIIQNGTRVAWGTVQDLKWQIAQGRGSMSLEEAFLKITETPAGVRSAS